MNEEWFLDEIGTERIRGWIFDREAASPSLLIFKSNGEKLFEVTAGQQRTDVLESKGVALFCGFDLSIDPEIWARIDSISIETVEGRNVAEIRPSSDSDRAVRKTRSERLELASKFLTAHSQVREFPIGVGDPRRNVEEKERKEYLPSNPSKTPEINNKVREAYVVIDDSLVMIIHSIHEIARVGGDVRFCEIEIEDIEKSAEADVQRLGSGDWAIFQGSLFGLSGKSTVWMGGSHR